MIYYANKFEVSSKPIEGMEYEVLNELRSPYRSDGNCLKHTRFLFESDSLPLEEQKKLIEQHLDNISRVTFSGKKSYHVIIEFPHNYEDFCKNNYKLIWNFFNEEYFDGKCDTACSNPSRLTRKPGVIRKDTGKEQKLIFNGGNQVDSEAYGNCYIYVYDQKERMLARDELTSKYLEFIENGSKVDCSRWEVVTRYLDTPFPYMTGNGNSSKWLYAALKTCQKYDDEHTMQLIIDKAKREGWTDKEIQHKLK